MDAIKSTFPSIFEGRGSGKPTCAKYRRFSQTWGWQKTLFEMADEKIEKIAQVAQIYLTTFLNYLAYSIDKGEAEHAQYKFDEQRRKMESKH